MKSVMRRRRRALRVKPLFRFSGTNGWETVRDVPPLAVTTRWSWRYFFSQLSMYESAQLALTALALVLGLAAYIWSIVYMDVWFPLLTY
jgi:hypothetical protein